MLIPSIDLMGGRIVQLVKGETLKLAFDDFEYWIGRFQHYPLVQLIGLDAAMRQGRIANSSAKSPRRLPCQVGGGISTVEKAAAVLSAGPGGSSWDRLCLARGGAGEYWVRGHIGCGGGGGTAGVQRGYERGSSGG